MRDLPQPNPRFVGIFIPSEILEMPELNPNEMFLLSWIDALYDEKKKGCYASNAYFAQKLRLKENTIVVMLTKLKRLGLIEQVSFDGRQRVIRACKENWFKEIEGQSQAGCDLNHSLTRTKITGRPLVESFHPYIYIKEDSKEDTEVQPLVGSPSSFSRKKTKEDKLEVHPRVWLTATQKESLLQKLEGNEVLLKKCYEILSDWKIGKGITGGPNDYSTFTKWVIDAAKDASLTSKTTKDYSEEDKKLATKIWERFKGRTDIHMGFKYIEFDNGTTVAHIEFGSKNFRGQCLEQLTRRKLNIEGF